MAPRPLLEQTVRHLEKSAREVFSRASPVSRGSDSVTVEQFRAEWPKHKKRIARELADQCYLFSPMRSVVIAKDKSKRLSLQNARPISILTVADRVVQRAMLHALWTSIRDRVHTDWSFGGIRTYPVRNTATTRMSHGPKSVRQAIGKIVALQDRNQRHVFETDIRDFYRNIDQDRLFERLASTLPDESLHSLLRQAISTELDGNANLGEFANLWHDGTGIPQGSVLSPVLANYYLYDFDKAMSDAGFSIVRYVDDLVVMCNSATEAHEAYEKVRTELATVGLEIHDLDAKDSRGRIKTRVCAPSDHFDFLGARIYRNTIQPTPSKWDLLEKCLTEITDYRPGSESSLVDIVRRTNNTIQGWLASFAFCNFSSRDIESRIDRPVRERLSGWLRLADIRADKNPLTNAQARVLGVASGASVPLSPIRPSRKR